MCNQFTLHHKFRIDSERTKFEQRKTDSILYGCESFEQGTQRFVWDWLERTTSCMVQAEKVEKTSRHGVLGRFSTCSTDRIEVLSNKIERNHPLRHTPSLLSPTSYYDGIWRSHIRESICVTSVLSKDLLETWLEERIGFRGCSTTRRRSYLTIKKFPTKPTKSKPRSW